MILYTHMKTTITFLVSIFFGFALISYNTSWAKAQLKTAADRDLRQNSFQRGEYIRYGIYYIGRMAEAEISVDAKEYVLPHMPNRKAMKVDVKGRTTGVATAYRVDDLWRSYLDEKSVNSLRFYRALEENKYRRFEQIDVYPSQMLAKMTFEQFSVDRNDKVNYGAGDKMGVTQATKDNPVYIQLLDLFTQDLVSGYYYLRTLDYANMQPGQIITIPAYFENKYYSFQVRFDGKEATPITIRTPSGSGKVMAYKFTPVMTGLTAEEGSTDESFLFRGAEPIHYWISADENKIPLRVETKIFLGKLTLELEDFRNLRHPISFQ
ncbi:MAG: DUF3108 domain-containing protein [Cytophagales bacterium]|nr:MAG: DUF3108 domain-containing protein [Cytophagales bacterium]